MTAIATTNVDLPGRTVFLYFDDSQNIDDGSLFKTLRHFGFESVFYMAKNYDGLVAYPSEYAITAHDGLAQICRSAAQYGIRVYANLIMLDEGYDGRFGNNGVSAFLREHPEAAAVHRDGRSILDSPVHCDEGMNYFCCPLHEVVRKRCAQMVVEVGRSYQIAGVNLDCIRYPMPGDFCYCSLCKKVFAERTAHDILEADTDLLHSWRCWVMTQMVREICDSYRACVPRKTISALVWRPPTCFAVGQAWKEWPVDFVTPMYYTDHYFETRQQLLSAIRRDSTGGPAIVPALGGCTTILSRRALLGLIRLQDKFPSRSILVGQYDTRNFVAVLQHEPIVQQVVKDARLVATILKRQARISLHRLKPVKAAKTPMCGPPDTRMNAGASVQSLADLMKDAASSRKPTRTPIHANMQAERTTTHENPLGSLWNYLATWLAHDGGMHGPVVHRMDLKRMWSIHDTPWTQTAAIEGLLRLFRRSGSSYWLEKAVQMGNAQASRQEEDGRFRWAGHENDRYSSLVHNALADCALLGICEALTDTGDGVLRQYFLRVVERNVSGYLFDKLYSSRLGGFRMNPPIPGRSDTDRFIVNMNSVTAEVLVRLDRQCMRDKYRAVVETIGARILELHSCSGDSSGSFAYSHVQPDVHIPLYTGLALRGLPHLYMATGNRAFVDAARSALLHLRRMRDSETGFWFHMIDGNTLLKYPLFVAGSGIIGNGIEDVSVMTAEEEGLGRSLVSRLLECQLPHGGIRNFIGYDHPDNGRPRGTGEPCWEDEVPTPNWNAHAFSFLSRHLEPPDLPTSRTRSHVSKGTTRFLYFERRCFCVVLGLRPSESRIVGVFIKLWRRALALSPHRIAAAVVGKVKQNAKGKAR